MRATPAQQRVLAVGGTRDHAEASENPPFLWNPALRRPLQLNVMDE